VAEVLLCQFGVEPLGQEQCRKGMPEVMEADGSKPSVLEDLLEPVAKDRSVERLPGLRAGDGRRCRRDLQGVAKPTSAGQHSLRLKRRRLASVH
jgi:hypothetical protein